MSAAGTAGRTETRSDIQALRGLAVLFVVIYHSGLGIAPSGYLGVDVFFVISGFLITGIIMRARDAGRFSVLKFYVRRIWRLVPAALVVIAATLVAAPALLTRAALPDFWLTAAGSVSFLANFVLQRQLGYFAADSHLNPLLHFWSLAIEGQYYLLLAPMAALLGRRWFIVAIALTTLFSLLACFVIGSVRPGINFFLLPFRWWELGLGSLGALLAGRWLTSNGPLRFVFWPALAVVLVLPFVRDPTAHPGIAALAICLATLVLLLRGARFAQSLALRPMVRLGDISYSLYLVHWPILSFLANVYVGQPTPAATLVAVAVSLLLAVGLHVLVEQPFRHGIISWGRGGLAALAGGMVLVTVTALGLWYQAPDLPDPAMEPVSGIDIACNYSFGFTDQAKCRTGPQPEMLVWGDSFAMHIVPGIVASTGHSLWQATKSACAPILGISAMNVQLPRGLALECAVFNDDVVKLAQHTPSVQVVVLSARLERYLVPWFGDLEQRQLYRAAGDWTEISPDPDKTFAALQATVAALRGAGKRVVLVASPPSSGLNAGICRQRLAEGRPTLLGSSGCDIPKDEYLASRADLLRLLERLRAVVPVLSFDPLLCGEQACRTELDGVALYRDPWHLSEAGSRQIGKALALGETLWRMAR